MWDKIKTALLNALKYTVAQIIPPLKVWIDNELDKLKDRINSL